MKTDLISIQDAANLLGVSASTLRRWEDKGVLVPFRTHGNQRRYSKLQLANFKKNSISTLSADYQDKPVEIPLQTPQLANIVHPEYSDYSAMALGFKLPKKPKKNISFLITGCILAFLVLVEGFVLSAGFVPEFRKDLDKIAKILPVANESSGIASESKVLGATEKVSAFILNINVPSFFDKKASFMESVSIGKILTVSGESILKGGIDTKDSNINAGKGHLTASNVIYGLSPGDNITLSGDKQNPTISANLALIEGADISISGLTVNNTSTLESVSGRGGCAGCLTDADIENALTISSAGHIDATSINSGTVAIAYGGTGGANATDARSNLGAAARGANSDITELLGLTTGISVNQGGTGVQTFAPNGVLYGNGTNALQVTTAPSAGQILLGNGLGSPSFFTLSGDISVDGTGSSLIQTDAVELGSDTTGNYQAGTTAGNGLGLTGTAGEGWSPNIALGNFTADWVQQGAFDLVLDNNASEIKIADAGGTSYATIDVGSLGGDRRYVFPDFSGTDAFVCLSIGNCSGQGGTLTGSGTTNMLARFTTGSSIADSSIYDDGTKIGIGTTSPEAKLNLVGSTTEALALFNQTGSGNIFTASASSSTVFTIASNGNITATGVISGLSGLTVASGTVALPNGQIDNSELANSSITVNAGTGLSGGGSVSLGGTVSLANTGVTSFQGNTGAVTVTAGTGINISGTTISNTGVTSLTGTANQVSVSGATGDITLGLPQNIHSAATPTFSSLTLSNNTNPLILGTTNTGTFALGSLTAPRTFTLPDASGTVCLTSGNCTALGGTVTTSGGTSNRSAKFNGSQTITDGSISDQYASGVALTIDGSGNLAGIGTITGLTGITSSGTVRFSSLGAGIAHFDSSGVLTSSAINLSSADVTGTLAVANGGTGGANASTARTNLGAAASGANSDITSLSGLTTALTVGQGGTGVTSFTTNGVLYGDATIQDTAAGTSGQLLVANGSGVPTFVTLSSDAALNSAGALTLANSGVSANTYGSASQVPVFAVDVKGRVTTVTNTNIAIAASAITSGTLSSTRGGTGANLSSAAQGAIAYFSSTGVMNALAAGTSGYFLTTNGASANPSWTDPNTIGFWDRSNGAVYPKIASVTDILIGGTSTASAKFAFINVTSGTPTASISGNIVLDNTGSLQTTKNQTLTIGGNTTGNIVVSNPVSFSNTLTLNGDNISDFTGNGLATSSNAVGVNLTSSGTTGASSSNSGLEVGSGGLTLLKGCGDNQILKYTDAGGWACAADDGAGGGTSKFTEVGNVLYPNSIANQVGIGTQTTADVISSFFVTRDMASGALGKALGVFNQTEAQDILTASSSGVTKFALQNNGNFVFAAGTSYLQTLTSAATAARTYTFPDASGTVCLSSGNCSGAGGTITGSGTNNYITKFTGSGTVGDSTLYDNGNIGIGSTSPEGKLHVNGAVTGKALVVLNETGNQAIFTASASGSPVFTLARNGNISATGTLTGLTGLTVASGVVTLPNGQIDNSELANSTITVSAGTGMSGGGAVSLGGSVTLNNAGVTSFQGSTGAITLAAGSGIDVTGTTITNTGVTSLTGTANQISVSGATGDITLSLPQNIHSGATPTFSALNLSSNTNQLVLGTTNTGTVSMASLTGSRIYTFPDSTGTVCLTSGNCVGLNGEVVTGGGTTNRSAKFTGSQTVSDGSISDQYPSGVALTINASGNLAGIGTLTGLTGLTSSGTITFSGLGAGVAHFNSSGVLSSSAVNLANSDITGTLAVANGGTGGTTASTARTNLGAGASGANSDITSLSGLTTALSVGQGGTGVTSLTTNAVLYGGSTVQNTAAGTSGQLLVANGSGVPSFVSLSSDATLNSTGALTLANSGVSANTYGSATQVAQIAIDVKGRITSASNVSISGLAASALTADTLDYTEFKDSMTLDAATSVAFGSAGSSLSYTLGTNVGNGNLVVSPNAGGQAALIINKQGSNDIFTASASGTTRLAVTNAGNIQISAGASIDTLTAGSISIGNTTANSLTLGRSGITTTFGSTSWTATPTISGLITANGGVTVASGQSLTLAGITGNNAVLYGTSGTGAVLGATTNSTGLCLLSGASAPSWQACPSGGASSASFRIGNGALSPVNDTLDLLIGNAATTSAKFAFINVAGGTPTASISASSGNNAVYLTGTGNLSTTNKQTLTLGGASTGNIVITSGNTNGLRLSNYGSGILHSDASGNVTSTTVNLSSEISSTLGIFNGGTAATSIGGAGSIPYSNGSAYAFSGVGTSGQALISGGSGSPTWFAPTLGSILFAGTSGVLAQDNANFFWDDTNNRLGIGTAAPLVNLDIRGTSGTLAAASISAQSSKAALVLDNSGVGDLFTASKSGATKFVIANNGNVGIGTSIPSQKLDIVGSMQLKDAESQTKAVRFRTSGAGLDIEAGGTQLFFTNWSNANFTGTQYNYLVLDNTSNIAQAIGTWQFRTVPNGTIRHSIDGTVGANVTFNENSEATDFRVESDTDANALFIQGSTDRIGIGTATPLAKLDVRGGSNTSPAASISGQTSKAAFVVDNSGVGDLFTASKSGSTKFVIANGGNVGIGTSLPTTALDVNGEIKGTKFSGSGLSDCDAASSKLLWDTTTKLFSCGTDSGTTTHVVRKSADETTSSDTTLSDDSELSFAVGANENWTFILNVLENAPSTADWKFAITAPAGSTCDFNVLDDANDNGFSGCGTATTSNGATGTTESFHIGGAVATAGTSGTVHFQWSQFSSDVGTNTILRGSTLMAFKTGGADVAEIYYTKDDSVQAGDIVRVDGSIKAGVAKTEKAYDNRALGIISTEPGIVLGDKSYTSGMPVLLALNGRVPVKVSSENGPIEPGDYLTTSSKPGVAMKATHAGQMIGKALAGYSNEDQNAVGTVLTFVNLSWADPSIQLLPDGSISADSLNQDPLVGLPKVSSSDNPIYTTSTVKAFENDLESVSATMSAIGSQLADQQTELTKIDKRISAIETLASQSAFINPFQAFSANNFIASSASELNLKSIDVNKADISGRLSVLGRTLLSDVGITGQITSGLLSINGLDEVNGTTTATINTSAGALMLQSTGLNPVDILKGKFVFTPEGSFIVNKDITAQKFNVDTSDVLSASLGEGTILSGDSKSIIKTHSVTTKSRIFITPKSKTSLPLAVTAQKDAESFTVEIEGFAPKEIEFNWWIVN